MDPDERLNETVELRIRGERAHVRALVSLLSLSGTAVGGPAIELANEVVAPLDLEEALKDAQAIYQSDGYDWAEGEVDLEVEIEVIDDE